MIALIAATALESEQLRSELAAGEPLPGGFPVFLGLLGAHEVKLVISGVGKTNAAAATALLLAQTRPSLVVSFGCGGAFPGSGLQLGDLALATAEAYGDEGVETPQGFLDMKSLGFSFLEQAGHPAVAEFPVPSSWLKLAQMRLAETAQRRRCHLQQGRFVTVSSCSGSDVRSAAISARSHALCETMEGAAVAQMCAAFGRPFLNLRGISNLTGDRDLRCWDLPRAISAAQEAVADLLDTPFPEPLPT